MLEAYRVKKFHTGSLKPEKIRELNVRQLPAELQHSFHSLDVVGFGVNPQNRLGAGESDE